MTTSDNSNAATRSPGMSKGSVIHSATDVGAGSVLLTQLSDGEVVSTVNDRGGPTFPEGDDSANSHGQRHVDEGNT